MLIKNLLFWWALLAFVVICTVASEKSYLRSKKGKNAVNKQRNAADIGILLSLVVFEYCLYLTVPTVMDICNNDYISAHGEFCAYNRKYEISAWIIADEGESISLKVPFGSRNKFPFGEHSGTIWYAENSQYLNIYLNSYRMKPVK